jgi:hypothetical protein
MAVQPSVNHAINCGVATTSSFARQFAKQTVANRTADLQFSFEYTPISSPQTINTTIGDINYVRNTSSTSSTNTRVQVNYLPEKLATIKSIESGNTNILSKSISDPNLFEYQSSGSTPITVTFNTNEKITKLANASIVEASKSQDTFQNFSVGSLGYHIFNQMRQYADGSTDYPQHLQIYSNFDYTNNKYTKNINCWAGRLDFSGVTVNHSGGEGSIRNLSAITPYHAIGAEHFAPLIGDTYYFCDSNNQTVIRTVQNVINVPARDCCVVRFSEALPSSVKKYKTLPSNYLNYLPINRMVYNYYDVIEQWRGSYIPIVCMSHYRWDAEWPLQRLNRYAYVYQTDYLNNLSTLLLSYSFPANSYPNDFSNYDGVPSGVQGGDSGSPLFFIINNDLVIAYHHQGAASGYLHASYLDGIQNAINTLGPSGYSYGTVDLSQFTSFA